MDEPLDLSLAFRQITKQFFYLTLDYGIAFVPYFVNVLELVEALVDFSKFYASLLFTFIVASNIDRSLSFRSKPKYLYSLWNLDRISCEIVYVEEQLAIESFTEMKS